MTVSPSSADHDRHADRAPEQRQARKDGPSPLDQLGSQQE
jgi:hypothetical protein